jgi:hypothetical protein
LKGGAAMIKQILDDLDTVAKAIENIKKITKAVKEGTDYVKNNHPDIKNDLRLMVSELQKTMNFIAQTSSVLTHFRFAMSISDLSRFNDYFMLNKDQAQNLRIHIKDLKGSCGKIREHAFEICKKSKANSFTILFKKLGVKSPEREKDLAEKLDRLAYEDFDVANSSELMLKSLESALIDIQNALGANGMMYPENIPKAAKLLSEYAPVFEALEKPARAAADDIQKTVMELV